MTKPTNVIAFAEASSLRDNGYSILPVGTNKQPRFDLLPKDEQGKSTWSRYQSSLATDDELSTWFKGQTPANIGMACGAVSGNLIAFDFDIAEFFPKYREAIKQLAPDVYKSLKKAVRVSTPKGVHLLVRCSGKVGGPQKLTMTSKVDDPGTSFCAIETRAEGSYVVAPPTANYEVVNGDYADIVVLSPEDITTMIEVAQSLTDFIPPSSIVRGTVVPQSTGDQRPGDAYNESGDILPLLAQHGWDQVRSDSMGILLRRPGKTHGVSARLLPDGNLYVFSSNAAPFEPQKAHTPFFVRTHLEFGGDFRACAQALLAEGYGNSGRTTVEIGTELPAQSLNEGENDSQDWEPPIPFGAGELPTFPTHIFPPTMRRFVHEVSHSIQTPTDLAAMVLLSTVSTVAMGKAEVRIKSDHCEPLAIWTCSVLEPSARKSPVFSLFTRPLMEREREIQEGERETVLEYEAHRRVLDSRRDALIKRLEACTDADEETELRSELDRVHREIVALVPVRPTRLWADDATPERMVTLLADHGGKMSVLSSEGGIFDLMAGRYSNGVNLDVYLKAYSGDAIRCDRKGQAGSTNSHTIYNPRLTMGLTVQPDVLGQLKAKQSMIGRGLMARFLYTVPVNMAGYREVDTPEVSLASRAEYSHLLKCIFDLVPSVDEQGESVPHEIRLSPQARQLLLAFAAEIERQLRAGGELDRLLGWGGKLLGHTLRVAGLLHLMRHAEASDVWERLLDAETMQHAIDFGRYCIPHAQAAYHQMQADETQVSAVKVLRWITQNGVEQFTVREVQRHISAIKTSAVAKEALTALTEHGYVRVVQCQYGRGQTREVYQVNPAVHRPGGALSDAATDHIAEIIGEPSRSGPMGDSTDFPPQATLCESNVNAELDDEPFLPIEFDATSEDCVAEDWDGVPTF